MRTLFLAALLPLTALAAEPLPEGWFLAGPRAGFSAASSERGCGGARAITLESKASPVTSATAMELLPAQPFRGQRLRFAGTVATRDVTGRAGLWMRVDGEGRRPVAFDNMQDRPLTGTWRCSEVSVVLDVPEDAVTLAVGVVLEGGGRVELSAVRFAPVPVSVRSTDLLHRGLALGAPGLRPEQQLFESSGRVDEVWFTQTSVQGKGFELRQLHPGRWTDVAGDNVVTLDAGELEVRLGDRTGRFSFLPDADGLFITGTWGGNVKYPLSILLTHDELEVVWGPHHRRLTRAGAAPLDPRCVQFHGRATAPGLAVCGEALGEHAPAVQTTVAFLLSGVLAPSL